MVATRPIGAMMRYRLLDTTRAYALEIGIDDAELAELAVRHAAYYRRWLEQIGAEWPTLSTAAERAPHFAGLNNVRAALEWCFGADGDAEIGVGLAAAAAPVFLAMSLLPECHRWSERAILALDDAARGGSEEMHLQAALGSVVDVQRGDSDAARVALNGGLAIAEAARRRPRPADGCSARCTCSICASGISERLWICAGGAALAGSVEDPAAAALAQFLLGISLHLSGDLGGARAELEAALRHGRRARGRHDLSRLRWQQPRRRHPGKTLWLQGHRSRPCSARARPSRLPPRWTIR